MLDRLRLSVASAREKGETKAVEALLRQLAFAESWQKPVFPLSGADMLAGGLESGLDVGRRLKQLEDKWIASGFELSKVQLLDS